MRIRNLLMLRILMQTKDSKKWMKKIFFIFLKLWKIKIIEYRNNKHKDKKQSQSKIKNILLSVEINKNKLRNNHYLVKNKLCLKPIIKLRMTKMIKKLQGKEDRSIRQVKEKMDKMLGKNKREKLKKY